MLSHWFHASISGLLLLRELLMAELICLLINGSFLLGPGSLHFLLDFQELLCVLSLFGFRLQNYVKLLLDPGDRHLGH